MGVEEFDGTASDMRSSPWLASEDLAGRDQYTLTIKKVFKHRNVKFEKGRTEPVVHALAFHETDKQMVINATNRRRLVKWYGPRTQEWWEQTVTLYVDHEVKLAGQTVDGIRVREKGSR